MNKNNKVRYNVMVVLIQILRLHVIFTCTNRLTLCNNIEKKISQIGILLVANALSILSELDT